MVPLEPVVPDVLGDRSPQVAFAQQNDSAATNPASDLRVTRRVPLPPSERHLTVGFRCVYDR